MAGLPKSSTDATLSPGEQATREALATLDFGEGPRVGVLGDSGTGKTFAMKAIVAGYLRRSPGLALVIDDKGPISRFTGAYRRDVEELKRKPVDEEKDGRVIVFRGVPLSPGLDVDAESIARLQLTLAQRRRPSMVVYDELDKAADGGQWRAGKESVIAWAFGKGRDLGAASLWGTQETEAVPRQAFNQSNVILCFRMIGNPLRLLKNRGYLEGGVEKVIPTLAGEPLPPAQRGTFVLLRRGRPWDGHVYKYRSA